MQTLGTSKPKPGLPLITAPGKSEDAKTLFQVTEEAVKDLSSEDKDTLLIKGVVPAEDSEYDEFL